MLAEATEARGIVVHEVKIIRRKGCGNCEAMDPELKRLSEEVPVRFIDAGTLEGAREIDRTGLPQVVLPLVNVDNRVMMMGYHTNIRGKVLRSLIEGDGASQGNPKKILLERLWSHTKNLFCTQDVEFNLETGKKTEKKPKCVEE